MIVRMKKIFVIFAESETCQSLLSLRDYGDLHPIIPSGSAKDRKCLDNDEKIKCLEQALAICAEHNCLENNFSQIDQQDDGLNTSEFNEDTAERIIGIAKKMDALQKEIEGQSKDLEKSEGWGKTDGKLISELSAELAQKGFMIKFFRCKARDLAKIPPDLAYFEIFKKKNEVTAGIIIPENASFDLFREVYPPQLSPYSLRVMAEEKSAEIKVLASELRELTAYEKKMSDELESLKAASEFEMVRKGIDDKGKIGIISGYCPEESLERLRMTADREKWAILAENPSQGDAVPTLTRHSWLSSLFRPVMDFMGLVPSYGDPDTNLAFLAFFAFFFALLVGDAGYGLIMLAATSISRIIKKDAEKEIIGLFFILSLSSVIWGAVTGMWFGSEKIAGLPWIRNLIIPGLYGFSEKSGDLVIKICMMTALCHLSFAHAWKGIRIFPDQRFMAEAGWISILFGIYKVSGALILGHEAGPWPIILIPCGGAMVILFGNPGEDGIKKNLASAISGLPGNILSGLGCFSDSISYIRLFAVGLATKEMASAFNNLAVDIGSDTFFSAFLAIIVLLSGHAVNIMLSCMSVMVHGMRLNILEFSTHLSMEWAGFPYKPFRLARQKKDPHDSFMHYRS